jgi:hypothetical protein
MTNLYSDQVNMNFTFEEDEDLTLNDDPKVSVLELSSFLYDFTLLHDCITLAVVPEYQSYNFSPTFWFRNGRPLKDQHKLYLESISHNSPLGIEVIVPIVVGTVSVPWLLVQAIEKIQNWPLNREKLRLEVEKLELENEQRRLANSEQQAKLESVMAERDANQTLSRILKRLEKHPFIGVDMKLRKVKEHYKRR